MALRDSHLMIETFDPTTPAVALVIGEQIYLLAFTFQALAMIEAALDARGVEKSVLDGIGELNLSTLGVMFAASLKRYQPAITPSQAFEIFQAAGVDEAMRCVSEAWLRCVPLAEQKRGAAKDKRDRGQKWADLLAFARITLGVDLEEFYALTPRYLDALTNAYRSKMQVAEHRYRVTDLMLGQLTAMVANTGFRGFEEPLSAEEFLPRYATEDGKAPPKRRPSDRQLSDQLRQVMSRASSYQAAQVERGA